MLILGCPVKNRNLTNLRGKGTVFENHRKSLIQHSERGQKLIKNAKNGPIWRDFENLKLAVKQCYQTGQF